MKVNRKMVYDAKSADSPAHLFPNAGHWNKTVKSIVFVLYLLFCSVSAMTVSLTVSK